MFLKLPCFKGLRIWAEGQLVLMNTHYLRTPELQTCGDPHNKTVDFEPDSNRPESGFESTCNPDPKHVPTERLKDATFLWSSRSFRVSQKQLK